MSSILKALKKLEDENNARTPDSLKINAEILRGGDSARPSTPGILLAALLLFLCGGVAMYFFMKPGGYSPAVQSSPAPVERSLPEAIAPVAPDPTQSTSAVIPRHSPAEAPQSAEKPKPRSSATYSPAGVKDGQNAPFAARNAAKGHPAPEISRPAEQPEIPIVGAQPLVRVNGIAFQDGSDSVAVINGVPVTRGALVEGVKVEEIQRDRVQFSYGGEKFEVFLGKTNR